MGMRIILTHEQADFDAVASMLGAYLLDDSSVPVLPRKRNRNVNAFITLYGAALPFIEISELGDEPIDTITLVDTQSLVSLKGVETSTDVYVIDHHPRRENLPAHWKINSTETGAATTILVEELETTNGNLSPIYATLLLLGIYEDTGSLTYSRTKPVDIRAAAYLVENGADLQVAGDFLNHPLTKNQYDLYDRLRAHSETLRIHGYNIIIASGDANEMEEELSTIAHKLRDLLDPDALFLLVKIRGGIQLIARSTSDNINVAEIVGHFNGGGHERAAASIIPHQDLQNIYIKLKKVLSSTIRPAITVAQIMSRKPQLLSPDTTIRAAEEKMRRFGYEGFPVVETVETPYGQQMVVKGLITRRSVDRTLSHRYEPYQTVGQAMESGNYTIRSDDSVETLQRLMIDSGWGQIPVVDAESGEITGIVTRTDLIKTLLPPPHLPDKTKLVASLESTLPEERLTLLKAIAQMAAEQHNALYIVGGFVRDLLLERPSLDFDLVVEGDAIQLAEMLANRWGGRVTHHSQFGTAKWHLDGSNFAIIEIDHPSESIDLVSARIEFYTHPTALPTVERSSIKQDLHRRDFTINTLALRLDGRHYGELNDFWGGLLDLENGIVRILHSFSFIDDPTRILRAIRFEQRFGFQIESRTLELLGEAKGLIGKVSGDRVRNEISHIISEPACVQIMERLHQLELLQAIQTHLTWDAWLQSRFSKLPLSLPEQQWGLTYHSSASFRQDLAYCLLLLRLPPEEAKAVAKSLKFSSRQISHIESASALWHNLPELSAARPGKVVAFLDEVTTMALYAVYFSCEDFVIRDNFEKYITNWKYVTPNTDGTDLKALGLAPGPVFRTILERLRSAWLDGEITDQQAESALLHELLSKSLKADEKS
jgi:tRNA nucleotidyltransferase (CCA-adding enzyme)